MPSNSSKIIGACLYGLKRRAERGKKSNGQKKKIQAGGKRKGRGRRDGKEEKKACRMNEIAY